MYGQRSNSDHGKTTIHGREHVACCFAENDKGIYQNLHRTGRADIVLLRGAL